MLSYKLSRGHYDSWLSCVVRIMFSPFLSLSIFFSFLITWGIRAFGDFLKVIEKTMHQAGIKMEGYWLFPESILCCSFINLIHPTVIEYLSYSKLGTWQQGEQDLQDRALNLRNLVVFTERQTHKDLPSLKEKIWKIYISKSYDNTPSQEF